ncbi:hypothetical protein [Methanoculleus sp.]|jgi:hypothetical protein|nr:hypothetical protein [Methanoculleus sp.]MDI6867910.1 hypothetical protein [Methanoculleus sp.]
MKTPKTRTLTLLIAVVLPLAYLTYWLLWMSALTLPRELLHSGAGR